MNEVENIIAQLEKQLDSIQRALSALREVSGSTAAVQPTGVKRGRPPLKRRGGKRNMTAEARKRMSEGQRRRWAEKRAAEAADNG